MTGAVGPQSFPPDFFSNIGPQDEINEIHEEIDPSEFIEAQTEKTSDTQEATAPKETVVIEDTSEETSTKESVKTIEKITDELRKAATKLAKEFGEKGIYVLKEGMHYSATGLGLLGKFEAIVKHLHIGTRLLTFPLGLMYMYDVYSKNKSINRQMTKMKEQSIFTSRRILKNISVILERKDISKEERFNTVEQYLIQSEGISLKEMGITSSVKFMNKIKTGFKFELALIQERETKEYKQAIESLKKELQEIKEKPIDHGLDLARYQEKRVSSLIVQ